MLQCSNRVRVALVAAVCALAGCPEQQVVDDVAVFPDLGADLAAEGDLAPADDLATRPMVAVTGTVVDLATARVQGATVSTLEAPAISALTDAKGGFKLAVPKGAMVTFTVTAPGYVKTLEQPVTFLKATQNFFLPVVLQAQFDAIQKAGGAAPGTAVVGIDVGASMACAAEGSLLGTKPATGKVLYVSRGDGGMNWMPDPDLTAAVDGPFVHAYVAGASGTITPTASPLKCNPQPYPTTVGGFYTIAGPITLVPGAYHDTQIFYP